MGFQRDKERSQAQEETWREYGTGYQEVVRNMICPHFTRDATGLWTCGERGRICTKKYDRNIVCDVKPVVVMRRDDDERR